MDKCPVFTAALLLSCIASFECTASNIHDLSELKQREAARHAFMRAAELRRNDPQTPLFYGQGQKVGGDKYINRLVDLNRQTGKALYRKAKKLGHNMKKTYLNLLRFIEEK